MSELSEEEIIKICEKLIADFKHFQEMREKDKELNIFQWNSYDDIFKEYRNAIQGLLDLYQKEKQKNKELEEYANWHISHLTEDISDYIDDDRIGNKGIIGELKEEREHWKDIIRINNNEKTYIDYKNY